MAKLNLHHLNALLQLGKNSKLYTVNTGMYSTNIAKIACRNQNIHSKFSCGLYQLEMVHIFCKNSRHYLPGYSLTGSGEAAPLHFVRQSEWMPVEGQPSVAAINELIHLIIIPHTRRRWIWHIRWTRNVPPRDSNHSFRSQCQQAKRLGNKFKLRQTISHRK